MSNKKPACPYTYYLFHIPTKKKYYGVRWINKCEPEKDLWIYYFGSSKKVDELLERYGKDSFIAEVRRIFETKEAALIWEQNVLRRIKAVERDDWLNQANIAGPYHWQGPHTEATKKKMRKPKSESTKQKLRGPRPWFIPWNKGLIGVQIGARKGKTHTEKARKQIKEKRALQIMPLHTDKWKDDQRKRMLGNTYGKGHKKKSKHMWISDLNNHTSKLVAYDIIIPAGYVSGRRFLKDGSPIRWTK
jgi:hypothetical protein